MTTAHGTTPFEIFETGNQVSFRLDSDMDLVEPIIRDIKAFLQKQGCDASSNLKLVLRELIINAIEHGNKYKLDKTVTGTLVANDDQTVTITVSDEGPGFDYQDLDLTFSHSPIQERNRGYPLVALFSRNITFNESGNSVAVTMINTQNTTFQVHEEKTWQVITPTGNLTAAAAERFQSLLRQLSGNGHTRFRFDLARVEDLDSMGICCFVVFSKALRQASGNIQLEIINAPANIRSLFNMTRLDTIYQVK